MSTAFLVAVKRAKLELDSFGTSKSGCVVSMRWRYRRVLELVCGHVLRRVEGHGTPTRVRCKQCAAAGTTRI